MKFARINPGCCVFNEIQVYVFGGRDANPECEYFNSIERLSTDVDIWSHLKIKMPHKLCNLFAFPVSNDYICLFGGLAKDQEAPNSRNVSLYSMSR